MDNVALERKKKHVAEEYLFSLARLQSSSKSLINVLTMLAEENIELAPVIVKVVEQHIIKVSTELKLPILYLIDSIVKNVKKSYVQLFGQCIVGIYCHVFEKVNGKTRKLMYKLRRTWSQVFSASKLYSLDTRVRQMDKNWPITAIKPHPMAIHDNFPKTVPPTEHSPPMVLNPGAVGMASNSNKVKVHPNPANPANAALHNCLRQRDPRLKKRQSETGAIIERIAKKWKSANDEQIRNAKRREIDEIAFEEPNKTEGDPKTETMADGAKLLNKLNIDELFQKLVSTGILKNVSKLKTLAAPVTTSNETSDLTEITTTTATDTDETQQCELEALDDISNQRSTNSPQPTCPAGPDDVDRKCDMCHEKFEQFYNEELEEWHLRQAVRLEDKIYHPLCYEDHKASLNPTADTETPAKTTSSDDVFMQENDNAVDVVIKIEEDKNGYDVDPKIVADDEDDDVIVLPNEEPPATKIDDDDEECVCSTVTREEMRVGQDEQGNDESAMEPDVEIQEPHIPLIDLDTYVEKELPCDESTQSSYKNVKIKEEPKEDDDDDDFEDVGTLMYGPNDEISLQISGNCTEETQTHTIISSVDSPATISGDPSPATNMFSSVQTTDSTTIGTTNTTHNERNADDGNNISIDGNLEPSDGIHNLSFSGPPPAVPLGSLVNKIKINIRKSSATAAQTATAVLSTETTTTTTSSNLSSTNISTIPVLCGGGTMVAPTALNTTPVCCMSSSGNSQVSNITVIGSYGSSYQQSSNRYCRIGRC